MDSTGSSGDVSDGEGTMNDEPGHPQKTANSWLVIEIEGWPHVVPDNDLKEHDVAGACWCAPVEHNGVIVHNSMDRREFYERGERMRS